MKIKNNRNSANYVNFKLGGVPMKVAVSANSTVDIEGVTDISQIINQKDFTLGSLSFIHEEKDVFFDDNKDIKEDDEHKDSLEKVEKEVENYTANKNKKNN